jgi:hypothetical protein
MQFPGKFISNRIDRRKYVWIGYGYGKNMCCMKEYPKESKWKQINVALCNIYIL